MTLTVPTKMTILFPQSAQLYAEEFGVCSATAWPRPLEDNTVVIANEESCKIETLSVTLTPILQQCSSQYMSMILVHIIFAWLHQSKKRNPLI